MLLFVAYTPNQAQTGTPNTPSGYTPEETSASPDIVYVFRKYLTASISSVSVTLTASPAGPVHLHMRSFTSTGGGNEFIIDQKPAINTGIASTTIATNIENTTGASASTPDICLGFFAQRSANGTTPTWSNPTNSYALTGVRASDSNGTVQLTSGIYAKTISANVTNESAGITSSGSTRSNAALISYSQTAAAFDPATFPYVQCPGPPAHTRPIRMVAGCKRILPRWMRGGLLPQST